MQIPSGPHNVRRRMAALESEIASLGAELQRKRAAGESTTALAMRLDDAQRERGLLEFYQYEAPNVGRALRAPEQPKPGAGRGCVIAVLAVALLAGVAVAIVAFVVTHEEDRKGAVVDVSEPAAVPAPVAPLAPPEGPGFDSTLTYTGEVVAVEGLALVTAGNTCKIVASPVNTKYNCRLQVYCAEHLLYGAGNSGFNNCKIANAEPVFAHDKSATDGDPICRFDLGRRSVQVRNDQPGELFSVTIRLEGPDAGALSPDAGDALTEGSASAPQAVPPGAAPPPLPPGTVPQPKGQPLNGPAPKPPPPSKQPPTDDPFSD